MTVLFQKRRFPENCFEAMDGFTRIPVEAEVTPSASVKTVLLMLFGLFDRDSSRKPDKDTVRPTNSCTVSLGVFF